MKFLQKQILQWYETYGRHNLPWRKENITPYEVWVSEIMLQQTQVNRVIEYYNRFLERFPRVEDLANASWEEFLPYYQGLGYYRRAENMLKTSKIVVSEYNGNFPTNNKDLKKLPGIGEYTANAILSFAYDQPTLSFDTNLQRIFGRYFYGDKKSQLDTESIRTEIKSSTKILNGALMDFANITCLSKKPQCMLCPLREKCEYVKNPQEQITTIKKSSFPTKEAQVFLYLHENHKKYFSDQKTFKPFILKAPYNTRSSLKKYFKDTYNLDLSIRPPHKKEYVEKIPTLYIRAQILLGEHDFKIFTKNEISL